MQSIPTIWTVKKGSHHENEISALFGGRSSGRRRRCFSGICLLAHRPRRCRGRSAKRGAIGEGDNGKHARFSFPELCWNHRGARAKRPRVSRSRKDHRTACESRRRSARRTAADADRRNGSSTRIDLLMVTVLRALHGAAVLEDNPNLQSYVARGGAAPHSSGR
jgi:hypothetical protein